jgi:prolipoprotein diacylglyceryl transferase
MGASVGRFMDAVAPAILVAQAIGRVGNYFNQELFGGPTSLPWALQIDPQYRPPGYLQNTSFHPTFLYELIWDLALAAFLVWLGHHRKIRPQGLFALYVAGYSAFRIFEESLRVDYSQYFLGLRLNFFVASLLTLVGIIWFVLLQRRPMPVEPVEAAPEPEPVEEAAVEEPEEANEIDEPGKPEETEETAKAETVAEAGDR